MAKKKAAAKKSGTPAKKSGDKAPAKAKKAKKREHFAGRVLDPETGSYKFPGRAL